MDLSQADFEKYIVELKSYANKNQDKRILFYVFGSSHGF